MSSSLLVSAVSATAPAPHVVDDLIGIVQLHSDGTVTRSADYSAFPLRGEVPSNLPVEWKDVVYDAAHALRLRMYRPTPTSPTNGDTTTTAMANGNKLPVLVYFHGGGFCLCSFELPHFHAGALRLAAELPAVVISADYRLAPEHRLPAAHQDAEAVLSWLRAQADADADPWLADSADLRRVFVGGDASGGNMAHHIAVRYGSGQLADLDPAVVRLAGCVLLWPLFAGEERTASEAAGNQGAAHYEQAWRLALPVGATRDHPVANPFGPDSVPLDDVAFPPLLVVDPDQDAMHDRIQDYAARLTAMGKPVELAVLTGQRHEFFLFDPCGEASDRLVQVIRRFVHGG